MIQLALKSINISKDFASNGNDRFSLLKAIPYLFYISEDCGDEEIIVIVI